MIAAIQCSLNRTGLRDCSIGRWIAARLSLAFKLSRKMTRNMRSAKVRAATNFGNSVGRPVITSINGMFFFWID